MSNDERPIRLTATLDDALKLGLTAEEWETLCEIQGGLPTYVELAIYSLMWSEHCSYKHSRPVLGRFPTGGPRVLQGPGENAGVVDVGDGWAVAMKVESHNHPSAVEPFQGAATGVGGIIRDIFTMGARPIASLDSLRFGELEGEENARQRYLFEHVVGGIGFYGNCIGIPTIAGEVYFEDSYAGNCLVNAMCAGLVRGDRIVRAKAAGVGNQVVLIGARTGRDGIGGASVLASQEFDETLEEKRPSVQVGDPFTEKKLVEACLELLDRKLVVSMQDLGAAGLTSSSSEMASKGFVGLDIHADRVPLREADMEPWEIMISESQERMLSIVEPARLDDVIEVCTRWDLDATLIGEVTDTRLLRILWRGEQVGAIPARRLADESPVIRTPSVKPAYLADEPLDPDATAPAGGGEGVRAGAQLYPEPAPGDEGLGAALLELLAAPNIASKRWAYEQYDYIVQANTVQVPGSDAAVLRVEGGPRGIAFVTDCNGRHCYLDPLRGARAAVAEAARNLSCVGALPVAVTDCLNFGNPEKAEMYWTFEQCVEGMAQACEALETPVVSGNVSFYNESFGNAIYPTPVVGMLGLLDDVTQTTDHRFNDEGDIVLLLGPDSAALDGSEYLKVHFGRVEGRIPDVDLELEIQLQTAVREGIRRGLLKSAHDCAEGGLAVALAECAVASGTVGGLRTDDPAGGERRFMGAAVKLPEPATPAGSGRADVRLFGEGPTRVVATVAREDLDAFVALAADVPCANIGHVTADDLTATIGGTEAFRLPVERLCAAYESLPRRLH